MTKSETYEERVKRVFNNLPAAAVETTAERALWSRQMADLEKEAAHMRADAMLETRDSLRAALETANRSGVFAGQDPKETAIGDATGVYGLINRALEIMGEGEAIERFNASCEWPQG